MDDKSKRLSTGEIQTMFYRFQNEQIVNEPISPEIAEKMSRRLDQLTFEALGIPASVFEEPNQGANLTSAKLREMIVEWQNKYPSYELHGKPGDIHVLLRFLGYPSARELYLDVDPYWPGDPMIVTRYAWRKTMKVVPMELFR